MATVKIVRLQKKRARARPPAAEPRSACAVQVGRLPMPAERAQICERRASSAAVSHGSKAQRMWPDGWSKGRGVPEVHRRGGSLRRKDPRGGCGLSRSSTHQRCCCRDSAAPSASRAPLTRAASTGSSAVTPAALRAPPPAHDRRMALSRRHGCTDPPRNSAQALDPFCSGSKHIVQTRTRAAHQPVPIPRVGDGACAQSIGRLVCRV